MKSVNSIHCIRRKIHIFVQIILQKLLNNKCFMYKEINDDMTNLERKWGEDGQPFYETQRTPDLENMDMEQYQQSIAQ